MGKICTLAFFENCNNEEVDCLNVNEIEKIYSLNNKDGKPYVVVNYYDDEFCIMNTLICDSVTFKTVEE